MMDSVLFDIAEPSLGSSPFDLAFQAPSVGDFSTSCVSGDFTFAATSSCGIEAGLPLVSASDLPIPSVQDSSFLDYVSSPSSNHSPSPSIDVSSPVSHDLSTSECGDDNSAVSFEDLKSRSYSSDNSFVFSVGGLSSTISGLSTRNAPLPIPTVSVMQSSSNVAVHTTTRPAVFSTTPKRAEQLKRVEPKAAKKNNKRLRPVTTSTIKQEAYQSPDEADSLSKRDRNKLSAAKYRKRRKVYLESLEAKVSNLEKRVSNQQHDMKKLETENSILKEQLAFCKSLLSKADGPIKPNNPKATAVLFVLFACLLMCTGHWHASTVNSVVSAIDDPSITAANNGRRLLTHGAMETESTSNNAAAANANDQQAHAAAQAIAAKCEADVEMKDAKPVLSVCGEMPALESVFNESSASLRLEDQKVQELTPEEKFVMSVFADLDNKEGKLNASALGSAPVVVKLERSNLDGSLATSERMS